MVEELNYLMFILSSESNNVSEYPNDVIGTLVDIMEQVEVLLSTAIKVCELKKVTAKLNGGCNMLTTIVSWVLMPFQSLFCKHDYYKKTWRTQENGFYRYSERLYCCEKCGREKWVHGDYDTINALTKEEKEFLAEMEERRIKNEVA